MRPTAAVSLWTMPRSARRGGRAAGEGSMMIMGTRGERDLLQLGRVEPADDAGAAPLFHVDELLLALASLENVQAPRAVAVDVLQHAAAHVAADLDGGQHQGDLRFFVECAGHGKGGGQWATGIQ